MKISDSLYGNFDILEPILLDLLESPEILRLKGVWQHGMPPKYIPSFPNTFTRYTHSVGVMLLLRRLGASIEEQIAGLTHDVSHLAFSHVYDWTMGEYTTNDKYAFGQDERHGEFVKNSGLIRILKKHNIDPRTLTDHTQFTLLEQDIPDICADRIDYVLRELEYSMAQDILSVLMVHEGKIVFIDQSNARIFADIYLGRNRDCWASYENASRYHILAQILRYALQHVFISQKDLYHDDMFVLKKIEETSDYFIQNNLTLLQETKIPPAQKGFKVRLKFRYVDPLFINNGKLIRLSDADETFARMIKHDRDVYSRPILVHDVV